MTVQQFETLQADIKEAMKAREKERLTVLRGLHSELKNISTNAGKELTEEDFVAVVSKAIKQRKDSVEQFKQGDTTLAECVKPVQELVIMCQAIAAMAAYGSPHLKGVAEVTKAVCKDCEAECRKHDNHMACQICADSCAPCMAECDRILDA